MSESGFPELRQTVLDTTDARRLAEFYRQLLGYRYRPGYEPPPVGEDDPKGGDWLILVHPSGVPQLAFQQVVDLAPATWPEPGTPQQLHLDVTVPDEAGLHDAHTRAIALGARLLDDRSADPDEALRVYADPDGHPFCIIVAPA
jgi:catechol 2,3-dioxygenase-like lactoylglutathione lyase family enzyme